MFQLLAPDLDTLLMFQGARGGIHDTSEGHGVRPSKDVLYILWNLKDFGVVTLL